LIPVLIEPSNLCFDLAYSNTKFLNQADEINEFKAFVREVSAMFDKLIEFKLAIAVTKELREIFAHSVPISIYGGNTPLEKLAIEVLSKKLKLNSKVVHKYGDHGIEIDFEEISVDKTLPIYNTDTYLHWRDMAALVVINRLPNCTLKSRRLTIFKSKYALLKGNKGISENLCIADSLEYLSDSDEVNMFRFILGLLTNDNVHVVPCAGTGTHSSMWGNSIECITDIPTLERELIKKLINTGCVKSLTFLSFEKTLPAVGSPILEIDKVVEKDKSTQLLCTLRGKGVKKHCQDVSIEIGNEYASSFKSYFGKAISLDKLDKLFELNVAITKEQ